MRPALPIARVEVQEGCTSNKTFDTSAVQIYLEDELRSA